MDDSEKYETVQKLREAAGIGNSPVIGESLDGKFIAERIAFEYYTDEEREAIRKKWQKQYEADKQVQRYRQEIDEQNHKNDRIREILSERNRNKNKSHSRKGRGQFWTK